MRTRAADTGVSAQTARRAEAVAIAPRINARRLLSTGRRALVHTFAVVHLRWNRKIWGARLRR